jgi:hypothetical protein
MAGLKKSSKCYKHQINFYIKLIMIEIIEEEMGGS